MERHGSESPFVLGEGLLDESAGGRASALSASIVRDPAWRPTLGPDPDTFRMVDLLLFAFEGKKSLLAPLG